MSKPYCAAFSTCIDGHPANLGVTKKWNGSYGLSKAKKLMLEGETNFEKSYYYFAERRALSKTLAILSVVFAIIVFVIIRRK